MSRWNSVTKKYGSQAAYLHHLLDGKPRDQLEGLLGDKHAREDDVRFYGDRTFRADEQKEKTAALNEIEIIYEGQEDAAKDPGYHPPVLPYLKRVKPYYKVLWTMLESSNSHGTLFLLSLCPTTFWMVFYYRVNV